MRAPSLSSERACLWRPGEPGTLATEQPSASRSMTTLNSRLLISHQRTVTEPAGRAGHGRSLPGLKQMIERNEKLSEKSRWNREMQEMTRQ